MLNNRSFKHSFLIFFQVTISTGILYYLFTLISTSNLVEAVTSAKLEFIVMALSISALIKVTEAHRMRLITDCQGMQVSTCRIFQINLISAFYELFLPPYVTGGAVRWYRLSQHNGKRAEALAAIGFNRLINLTMLTLIGCTFWLFSKQNDWEIIHGLALILPLGLLTILGIILKNAQIFDTSLNLLDKRRLSYIPNVIQEKLGKVIRAVRQFQVLTHSDKLKIIGLEILQNLNGILIFYLFAHSLELPLSLFNIAWIRACVVLVTMLPLSIAGLGIREGTLAVILAPYGVALEEAMALSILLMTGRVLWGTLGGMIEGWNCLWTIRRNPLPKEASI